MTHAAFNPVLAAKVRRIVSNTPPDIREMLGIALLVDAKASTTFGGPVHIAGWGPALRRVYIALDLEHGAPVSVHKLQVAAAIPGRPPTTRGALTEHIKQIRMRLPGDEKIEAVRGYGYQKVTVHH